MAIPTRALSGSPRGCAELTDAIDQRKPGPDRAFGVILVGLRIAKVDEHAVAHVFGDVATIAADDILDLRLVRTQELLQILRIKAGGESRRAHEVAKHHRELSPFGVIAESWAASCACRRRRELANGIEDFPPMADRQDSDLLQIVGRQAAQDVEVDPVVAKCLLVGLQAEAAQPLPDVHFASARAPPASDAVPLAEPATLSVGRSGSAGTDCPDRIWPSAPPAARSCCHRPPPRGRSRPQA